MLDFNLEYVRAFYYTAQLKSVSKAAEALFLSQPAVSNSIKSLEKRLHCQLFTRKARGMELTYEGEMLYERVSRAFDELFAAEKDLQSLVDFPERVLKIGVTETALQHFLLPKLSGFRQEHPNVRIHALGTTAPEVMSLLQERKVELGVIVSPLGDTTGLNVRELFYFQDILIASEDFSELKNRVLTPREIHDYPICAVEAGTSARNHMDAWFKEQGVTFNPDYTVRTTSSVFPFVTNQLSLGIVPSMFAEQGIASGKLFQVQLEPKIPPRQVVLAYHCDTKLSALAHAFIKHLLG